LKGLRHDLRDEEPSRSLSRKEEANWVRWPGAEVEIEDMMIFLSADVACGERWRCTDPFMQRRRNERLFYIEAWYFSGG